MRTRKRSRSSFKSGLPKRHAARTTQASATEAPGERLQKVMAQAGVGSRRDCEQLMLEGRVTVDGRTVATLGTRVDPQQQEIRLDGELLSVERHVYYAINKPVGAVSTNDDPSGRPRVIDLLPPIQQRVFTVGRLDLSSEGLMLVTNDGELANRLAHPRYGVEKSYLALVAGTPEPEDLEKLRKGVHLAEGVARVVSVHVRKQNKNSALLEIVLAEGKNREIRRVLAKTGHKVLRLKRVAIGPLKLKDLESGEVRRLTGDEVRELREASKGIVKRRRRPRRLGRVARPKVERPAERAVAPEASDTELARRHPKPGQRVARPAPASRRRR
ncbi:MAG TPA: pseudouridine synthase [Pirellulales bacterium]|jgi:23S rRNA pseudouridine2605 synthase|nr:pseudouridine synthase [Pirellulales bacterium]